MVLASLFVDRQFKRLALPLATSYRKLADPVDLDIAVAICNHFYQAYKRICGVQLRLPSMARLSEREAEILVRAAHGPHGCRDCGGSRHSADDRPLSLAQHLQQTGGDDPGASSWRRGPRRNHRNLAK